jgi:hypothetical protein
MEIEITDIKFKQDVDEKAILRYNGDFGIGHFRCGSFIRELLNNQDFTLNDLYAYSINLRNSMGSHLLIPKKSQNKLTSIYAIDYLFNALNNTTMLAYAFPTRNMITDLEFSNIMEAVKNSVLIKYFNVSRSCEYLFVESFKKYENEQ